MTKMCLHNDAMTSDLARIGAAIGSPARAAMINILFDGAPHTAGELATAAGVTSGTASGHLKVLTDAGIIIVQPLGRYRSYQMADARIAHALEQLSGPDLEPVTSLRLSREQHRVRAARTCYDHLAGQLGVNLAQRFLDAGWADPDFTTITSIGVQALQTHFGIHPQRLSERTRRPLVRPCRDWTEQRSHLAGTIGALIAQAALTNHWVTRRPRTRALTITNTGHQALHRAGILTTGAEPSRRTGPS